MSHSAKIDRSALKGLRTVATFEFLKGILVLAVGFGFVSLLRSDLGFEDLAEDLLYILHINPNLHLSQVFLNATGRLDDMNVVTVVVAAALYSTLRFVEAYGLWRARVWAEWLALLSGLIYLPLEIHHLVRKPGAMSWVILLVNVLIVVYMAYLRLRARSERGAVPRSGVVEEL